MELLQNKCNKDLDDLIKERDNYKKQLDEMIKNK